MSMDIKQVVGIILRDRKFLAVKKRGLAPLIMPGGKPGKRESLKQTLKRELREELGVTVTSCQFLGTYTGASEFEGKEIEMICFLIDIDGTPTPQREIEGMAWIGRDFKETGVNVAGLMERKLIPDLVKRGLV